MSNKRQETVADIVAEMRAIASAHGSAVSYNALREWVYEMGEVLELADRIEAAHFRECEDLREERNRAGLTEREKLSPRISELEAENARLRAALKPVLECKVRSAMTAETEPGRSDYCANIIEKAQRIYNEGGKK